MITANPGPGPSVLLPPAVEMADARLRLHDIVRRCLGAEVAVSHTVPSSESGGRCVNLYLLTISPAPTPAKHPQSLQLAVRFLVSVTGPDAAAAGDDLAELGFAALAEPGLEIDAASLPASVWAAWGAPPRPSLTLSMLLRRMRRVRPATPVREPVLKLTRR